MRKRGKQRVQSRDPNVKDFVIIEYSETELEVKDPFGPILFSTGHAL